MVAQKDPQMEITCPSGLAGQIRAMKGREAQAFVDPQLVRTFGSMDAMLGNCWLATTAVGPYPIEDGGKPPWKTALLGDRFHTMMEIRGATFGYDYDFNVKCESCEKQYGWELNLRDLVRKPLPAESFEKIRSDENSFELDLDDGKVLVFKLGTGVEEVQIAKLKGGAGSTRKLGPVDAIWVQTLAVGDRDGDKVKPIPGDRFGFRKYLEDVNYVELLSILEQMQEHDCGVETKIETVCEFCGWQQEIELPFQRSFFEPRRKKKAD